MRYLALTVVALALAGCATATNPNVPAMPGGMSEAEIAGIVNTANQGEINEGTAASAAATNADVRSFAQMMVTDHTNALNTARDVFSRHSITPAETDNVTTLRSNSATTVTNLGTWTGAAFDRTYMQRQVDLHQWLLNGLDQVLIPSASTPDVRQLLQTVRASVATHLDRARSILNGLP